MDELLPHDVIEEILERLPTKTLLKFKTVSKQWRSTIQSRVFQKRHHCRQSEDPHVLFVSLSNRTEHEAMRTLVVGSSVSVQIPTLWEDKRYNVCNTSCDGLICLYSVFDGLPSIVFNPTTRMHRTFPLCNYQLVAVERFARENFWDVPYVCPGFGKDKNSDTYKPVWLYNSAELGLNDNSTTTCEVFDFATNTWRYVVPASSHLILRTKDPVYVNGSLHWFTASSSHKGETMILSLDLHTETFQVISKAPFLHTYHLDIFMCNLDGRLCVTKTDWLNQLIWLFDSDHKIWKKICSMDLGITFLWFGRQIYELTPLTVLVNDKILFYYGDQGNALVTHDLKTKSYGLPYTSKLYASGVCCYFPSLISVL